jgi:hypothetical protein
VLPHSERVDEGETRPCAASGSRNLPPKGKRTALLDAMPRSMQLTPVKSRSRSVRPMKSFRIEAKRGSAIQLNAVAWDERTKGSHSAYGVDE